MENGKDSRVLLILNPVAGHKAARVLLYPLVKLVCANEGMATVYATSARGEAERIAREQGGQYDRILCCGGDGTLNEVLTGLVRAGVTVPVGYVPTGTTNDLAHALNLPTRLKAAMNLAVTGRPRGHDVGLINGNVMFDYVASFGAFADTAYSTPQRLKNALGRAAYFLCGIKQVFELKQHHIVLEADGKRVEGDFYYGSVSNSTRIAGIIDLKHAGVAFDDGRLEVLLIRQPPTVKALKDFQRGKYDPEYFYFFSARQVSIDFDEPAEWTADGECAGHLTRAEIRCLPRAVELIAPEA